MASMLEGGLVKKGSMFWNQRWCKVENGTFTYWKKKGDAKPKGSFSVKDVQVAEAQSAHKKFQFCFQIQTAKKTYFHCCEKKEELDQWIKALVANGAKENSDLYRKSRIAEDGSVQANKDAQPAQNAQTTQPAQTTETKPAETAQPAQTTQPTQTPAQTTEPAPATQPAQTTEPAPATQPAQTTEPAPATQPAQTTDPAPATQPASNANVTQGPAEINDKSEIKRPAEAAKFLKRSRHKFDFQSKLTPEQIEDFRKLFAVYDQDNDGVITIRELDEALLKIGYNFSPENVLTINRIVDENKDGVLNFEEFLGLYDFLDFLKGLFKSADKDNSGKLDRREVNHLLKRAGYNFTPEQVELLYRMCDEDGTDVIELEDFLSLILFIFWAQILFSTTDTDGNDSIDIGEFNNILLDLGIWMAPPDVMKFFKELDSDNSGTLSFEEYVELVFELRFPLISDLVRLDIKRTGVADELKEKVEIKPEEKINLMEASGFLKRTRHRFNFESKLTDEQKETFRSLFKLYDKDNSGTINIRELANVLDQLGYKFTPDNIETIMFIVDDNLDGVLNFNEFLGFYDFLEYLKTLFESADKDKDAKIDRAELQKLLEESGYKFSDKQVELFYKMCDSDGSGVIEVYDFFELTLFIFWAQILFSKADTDGNDSIELKEFNNNLKRLGIMMPPEGVVKYFDELDVDKDGHLAFEEYIELVFMLKFIDLLLGGM